MESIVTFFSLFSVNPGHNQIIWSSYWIRSLILIFLQTPVVEISGTVVLLQICPVLGNQTFCEQKINCKLRSWHIRPISNIHVYVCQIKMYNVCEYVSIVFYFFILTEMVQHFQQKTLPIRLTKQTDILYYLLWAFYAFCAFYAFYAFYTFWNVIGQERGKVRKYSLVI